MEQRVLEVPSRAPGVWVPAPRPGALSSGRGLGWEPGAAQSGWAAWVGADCEPSTLCPRPDVDECQMHNGGCHHSCMNTPGSYICECRPGFRLHADGRTCLGKCLPGPGPPPCPGAWPRLSPTLLGTSSCLREATGPQPGLLGTFQPHSPERAEAESGGENRSRGPHSCVSR